MTELTIQASLLEALESEQYDRVSKLLTTLHPSEIADLLESLPARSREILWGLIEPGQEGNVLSHAQDAVRTGLLELMQPEQVADATIGLATDDAADILQDLPDEVIDSVLLSMDAQNRARVSAILSYPEDTAGGLMNIDVVSVRADVPLDVVCRYLRQLGKLPEHTDSLMVVDRQSQYMGTLPLSSVLTMKPDVTVGEIMQTGMAILATTPDHEVARIFAQRDLISAAVVDEQDKLLGRITVDDVVDVIQDSAEQAVMNMAGLGEDDMFAPVLFSARRRAIWLAINLLTAFLASWVIGRFENTIEQLVALAVLMPIVASMGGNAGIQTLTIAVRGLALGQLSKANAPSLLLKEFAVGALNGVIWACVVALIAVIWFGKIALGIVIGVAMIVNLLTAAVAGAVIPMLLKKAGVDPAIASGVLLTAVTDVVGFMTFLGLATIFLMP
ncbi:MAG: magnesium transporter [Gammaproteobacteria bacterium RIFCSPLOWO2_02_FULL_52_10]|nr:MAG: magnesium transporter [Gammaproteobacteria bacterium RIFCSPLOWO2_02_FULL_52_10]